MQREFPITVYAKGAAVKVYGANEKPSQSSQYPDAWIYFGTYYTPEELGAAMLVWAMGGK